MPDFLSIPKAKQAASTVFGLAGTLYRAVAFTALGGFVVHQTGGPIMLAVVAFGAVIALRHASQPARTVGTILAVAALALAIADPALAQRPGIECIHGALAARLSQPSVP